MRYVADLHIHSHYSIATSKHADPEHLFAAAVAKGITLLGTGDLTHPGWRAELAEKLTPDDDTGLLRLRPDLERQLRKTLPGACAAATVRFVLSGEISSIYKKDGRVRKVHNVVLLPSLAAAERLSAKLEEVGNIRSDGRPILGLDCRELLAMTLESNPEACFIPAHIWTPHFSVFGSRSGFDTLEHCYGDLTGQICAVETGLSSDPAMNWRVSALDNFTLVSNSDAHSPEKLAREANLIEGEFSYQGLIGALKGSPGNQFLGTVEFYPEEGKYHYDGHRVCNVRLSPEQAAPHKGRCPVCGGRLTEGVLARVERLADRPDGARPGSAKDFQRLIPLSEVIAESLGAGPATKKVRAQRDSLLRNVGSELHILRTAALEQVVRTGGELIAEAVRRNREGEVKIEPGYDGQYGTVKIFEAGERQTSSGQMFFFDSNEFEKTKPEAVKIPLRTHEPLPIPDPKPGIAPSPATKIPATIKISGIALNEDQAAAASSGHTPLAVIAGPGTGKTRCLSARAAWLVNERGVEPSNVLALTFTNRAAAEMRRRITGLPGGETPAKIPVRAMTLHRFCLDFITRATGRAVSVADETDRAVLLLRAGGGNETAGRLREISEAISRARARGQSADDYSGSEDIRRAWTAYRNLCRRLGVLDYDDLIAEATALLKSDNTLRANTVKNLEHLLVDEFQDLNPAQYGLLRLLLPGSGAGLFVIGDPNQSIYAFRGADSGIFGSLGADYPGLHLLRLERGYRVPAGIADAAEAVIAPVSGEQSAPPVPVGAAFEPVRMIRAVSETSEALAIVREIGSLAGGTGMLEAHGQRRSVASDSAQELFSFAEMAVIARTAALLGTLEAALVTEGIPCRLRGGRSFLTHPLARGCAGWLRLLINPGDTLRALEAMGLAGLDVEGGFLLELRDRAIETGRPLLELLKHRISREVPLSDAARPAAGFLAAHDTFRRRTADSAPVEILDEIIKTFVPTDKRGIIELGHLRSAAEAHPTVAAFAGRLTLARQADIERRSGSGSPEAVTLMTMHAAKGLEFPVVFVAAAERELVPFTLRPGDPDEERRLLYVAMTRAAGRLYLTSASSRTLWGRRLSGEWSPLLTAIPTGCRVEYSPRLPRTAGDKQLDLL